YKRKCTATQAADSGGGKGPPLAVRIAQLNRLLRHRYGLYLPDDDAGREDAWIMAHHIAHRTIEAPHYMALWLDLYAPWMDPDERESLIADVLRKPLRFSADTLAKRLNVTDAERQRLALTTIGAVDRSKAERQADRKERDRQRKEISRRARGVPPRAEWKA